MSQEKGRKTNKEKAKGEKVPRSVILITLQNTDLTSWPQPSHMMGFGNEPIILTDADEFSQSCCCWHGHFNTYRIKRTIRLYHFLIKNNV